MSRYSRTPRTPIRPTTTANAHCGARRMSNSRSGMATAAVANLRRSTQPPLARVFAHLPDAALAPLVVLQCLDELLLAEVGPERLGDVDLRIRPLPEEEIRHSHLAAGADQQIRVGHAGSGEVGREDLL